MNKQTFHATATWDGKWWAVQIGGLPEGMVGVTQGRDKDDAKSMAKEAVALLLNVDESTIEIDMTFAED